MRETLPVTRASELRVLGGLSLRRGGKSVPLGGPKAQLLLAVLVAHRHGRVSADRLVEVLWAGTPPKSAMATIQSQISRLRAVLAPGFGISFETAGYRLEVIDGEVDASRFEALLARSRTLADEESLRALNDSLRLWEGSAYGQFSDAAEVSSEAVRLDELRLVATDEWAEARMAMGDPASMVGELEALVSAHPYRESYWRLLMLALYRTGRQAEALRRASELRSILGQEVGLDISPAMRELEAQVLADDPCLLIEHESTPSARPAVPSLPRLQGSTSFVGREPDVTTLSAELEQQPLVTITGAGGVGKTRLALRIAGRVIDEFEDGVTVVEFAALRDPSGTAQVIAQALDVQPHQHRTIETTIEDYLAPAHTLLVLDNCEHVTEILAPLVDRLRASCPDLRILATSRQSLGLAGEYVEVLAPLTLPMPEADLIDELADSSAVELFVSRAAVAFPGFVLTEQNSAAVADICRRLDGLPLALELAAAQLRTMGVDALAARLNKRIELLGQTQRGADGRQRTLHDLVKWSHDLLTPEERQVFEQLAVFAGGFDLAAAESVCTIGDGRMSAVGHIVSLVDKSMVVLVDPATSRYQLLESLREFGLDQLRESGALDAAEDRHLEWFVGLGERGAIGLDSPEEATWSADLQRDYDNFRAAHLTAVRQGDADRALRLVSALREHAFRRINYEITTWAGASAALDGAEGHPELPTALGVVAYGAFVRGDMQTAIELAHQALHASRDSELSASGLPERVLGNAHFYLEQTDEALRWMDRMVLSARRADSPGRIARDLFMQSVAYTSVGDDIRGAALAGEAAAAAGVVGSRTAQALADYAYGLALESADPDEALAILERAGSVGAEAGNRWIECFALTEVHSLRASQGDHPRALAGLAEVVDTWYRGGDWANQWLSLRRVLGVFAELDALDAAAVLHGALTAVGAAQAMPIVPVNAERLTRDIDDVRSQLGPSDFADAVRRGASMTDREIVSFVQQEIRSLTD